MQRPVLNPVWFEKHPPTPRRFGPVLRCVMAVVAVVRAVGRIALASPFPFRRRADAHRAEQSLGGRLLRGITYRIIFAPPLVILIAWALVFAATHSPRPPIDRDPTSQGVYYDPVTFPTDDGLRLDGWLVPLISAQQVLEQKDKMLRWRHPAVVLVHDTGHSRQELLPLVRPLHDAGFVLLLVGLRGGGINGKPQTFGLRESLDVKAAVDLLRRRPYVDPNRIGLVGIGTGANAAVLAAERDPALRTLALHRPVRQFDHIIDQHMVRNARGLRWMQLACKWTFEIACDVDADALTFAPHARMLADRRVLMLDDADPTFPIRPPAVRQVREFLALHLKPDVTEKIADAGQ